MTYYRVTHGIMCASGFWFYTVKTFASLRASTFLCTRTYTTYYLLLLFSLLLETRSAPEMFRVSYNRALGMFEQSTGSSQVQIELQRRRCTAVQGTQNRQTPLDAQENAKGQVLAMRKGR